MLKYIGGGKYLVGIPARDLDERDLGELGKSAAELIRTGLYQAMHTEITNVDEIPAKPKRKRKRRQANG